MKRGTEMHSLIGGCEKDLGLGKCKQSTPRREPYTCLQPFENFSHFQLQAKHNASLFFNKMQSSTAHKSTQKYNLF